MKKGQEDGAVVYLRVSTEEQANGPLNLNNQEQRCRDFCKQNGLSVVQLFTDPGVSGRSAARPEFQQMLTFCKAHRRDVFYVVVQDLSRFARNTKDQADAIVELEKHGVHVRSVYEPNVDETAAGKLAANMLGAFNQYFSDSLSEKMKDRTRASVAAGRFPWRAPIGYKNVGGQIGPNIIPDHERAKFIRQAFELIATGLYKKTEALQILTREGLRTDSGKPLSPQTFQAVLRNPLYCGWVTVPSAEGFEPVRGLHEPIVSEELFNEVQLVLSGKKPTAAPRRKHNPALPLKCFIKCEVCGTPLTGGFAKGRTKKYARYWCRKKNCRAVKLSKEQLEKEFVAMLGRLRPDADSVSAFPKVAAKVWAQKQGDIEKAAKKLAARLEEQKKLKAELLKAKLRGEVSQADYTEANAEYAAELAATEAELKSLSSNRTTMDAFVRFAELQLMDIAGAWQIAAPEQRQRVQNLLFQDGLHYSPQSGILNRSNSCLFTLLEQMTDKNGMLASPTGFEPVLPP
jgi:site-specific DNA recombinase